MTAAGKINASNVQAGDRIIVKARYDAEGHERITESATKTGEGVFVARVISKTFRAAQGRYEARGKYVIGTTAGSFEAAPIQTMWLAPEDAAGVKRAHAEALTEDADRTNQSEILDEAYAEKAERETAAGPRAVCYSTDDSTATEEAEMISTNYRYAVRAIGPRRAFPGGSEHGAEVVDTRTGDVMTVHWAASPHLASVLAEYVCAQRNAPETASAFPSKLALFVDRARDGEYNPGDILEDVSRILEWHLGRIRGIRSEPLSQEHLYVQAPEFAE